MMILIMIIIKGTQLGHFLHEASYDKNEWLSQFEPCKYGQTVHSLHFLNQMASC